jgi:hypothetical protein
METGREDVDTNQGPDTLSVPVVRKSKTWVVVRTPTKPFEEGETVEVFVPKEIIQLFR